MKLHQIYQLNSINQIKDIKLLCIIIILKIKFIIAFFSQSPIRLVLQTPQNIFKTKTNTGFKFIILNVYV